MCMSTATHMQETHTQTHTLSQHHCDDRRPIFPRYFLKGWPGHTGSQPAFIHPLSPMMSSGDNIGIPAVAVPPFTVHLLGAYTVGRNHGGRRARLRGTGSQPWWYPPCPSTFSSLFSSYLVALRVPRLWRGGTPSLTPSTVS